MKAFISPPTPLSDSSGHVFSIEISVLEPQGLLGSIVFQNHFCASVSVAQTLKEDETKERESPPVPTQHSRKKKHNHQHQHQYQHTLSRPGESAVVLSSYTLMPDPHTADGGESWFDLSTQLFDPSTFKHVPASQYTLTLTFFQPSVQWTGKMSPSVRNIQCIQDTHSSSSVSSLHYSFFPSFQPPTLTSTSTHEESDSIEQIDLIEQIDTIEGYMESILNQKELLRRAFQTQP